MANDLEKFLQQAAERLAQKSGGKAKSSSSKSGTSRSSPAPTSSPSSQKRSQPPRLRTQSGDEPVMAEVLPGGSEDTRRVSSLREAGPDPLSTLDTRPPLAEAISQADERMGEHVHQVFDHQLSQLRAPSESLARPDSTTSPAAVKSVSKSALIEMLRKPDSLRAAFIASEIFKRPT